LFFTELFKKRREELSGIIKGQRYYQGDDEFADRSEQARIIYLVKMEKEVQKNSVSLPFIKSVTRSWPVKSGKDNLSAIIDSTSNN
jgi:hypothetical protein